MLGLWDCNTKCVLDLSSVPFRCLIAADLSLRAVSLLSERFAYDDFRGMGFRNRIFVCLCIPLLVSIYVLQVDFCIYNSFLMLSNKGYMNRFFTLDFSYFFSLILLLCLYRGFIWIFLCTLSSITMIIISFLSFKWKVCMGRNYAIYGCFICIYGCVCLCCWALCTPYFIAYICC